MNHYFASESVCAGHPDKICDQISDAILDAALKQDPVSRLALETIATHNRLILAGEVKTNAQLDFPGIAREQIRRLGYTNPAWNFSDASPVDVYIHDQSPEIALAVDAEGAGDQGLMFGFACNQTKQLMPLPIMLSHSLTRNLDLARESGNLPYLRPDGKAQVVVGYENSQPVSVEHLTIAVPHDESVQLTQVKDDVYKKIVSPVLGEFGYQITPDKLVLNGTGVWHMPGPTSDAGLTGRKIAVDTYGGYARVGGGCFSGKDASKVDRSGAYAARFVAKNIVAHGLAEQAEVGLAYYIGGKKPVMLDINTFGTAKQGDKAIADFASSLIDLSVSGIIAKLDLRRPIYLQTATYGHFGKAGLPWEQIVP
ncbi:methionine adenosyltransferase [Candidatus Saccharibacteria bacterium]|nr:methionine adenosyltransferase [Candidatus Saccharibacteria bacterium]